MTDQIKAPAPTSISMSTMQEVTGTYGDFKNVYNLTSTYLQTVIANGAVLYNDPNMVAIFPNSWATYQQYLLNVQAAINNFTQNFPAEPPLNG